MLDCKDADLAFKPNDRHTRKAVEALFPRFRLVDVGGMLRGLRKIEHPALGSNGADEPLAHSKTGHMNRFLAKTVGCEKLEIIVAQEVDRANLALHFVGDEIDDLIELGLRRAALCHDRVETGQDLAGRSGG